MFEGNRCINLKDLSANKRATGLWLDGSPDHPIVADVNDNVFRNNANHWTYRHAVYKTPYTDLHEYLGNVVSGLRGAEIQDHQFVP